MTCVSLLVLAISVGVVDSLCSVNLDFSMQYFGISTKLCILAPVPGLNSRKTGDTCDRQQKLLGKTAAAQQDLRESGI